MKIYFSFWDSLGCILVPKALLSSHSKMHVYSADITFQASIPLGAGNLLSWISDAFVRG